VSRADVFGLTAEGRELVATMLSTVIARPLAGAGQESDS
jgi:hypothetical protein